MASFCQGPLFKTSRPRFWVYLVGPYLLGLASFANQLSQLSPTQITLALSWGLWLTFPANLFLYGVNDLFDEETDALNEKKTSYETRLSPTARGRLIRGLRASLVLGVLLATLQTLFVSSSVAIVGIAGLLLLGWQYSAPPLRAKARPFIDSASNILYAFPALIGAGVMGATWPDLAWMPLVAGGLWCMSMHAFSAVPDIHADTQAGLSTIATTLGKRGTIAFCASLYLAASALLVPTFGWSILLLGTLYLGLMIAAWRTTNTEALFRVYRVFPRMNTLVGFLLFWMVIWKSALFT